MKRLNFGVLGSEMRASGCEIEVELTQHAVMGFLEVLPKIRQFLKFAKQAECVFKAGRSSGCLGGFSRFQLAHCEKQLRSMVFQYFTIVLRNYGLGRDGGSERWVDMIIARGPTYRRKHF